MKKALCIAALIACIIVAICGILWIRDRVQDELWAWYDAGYDDGIAYALENYCLQGCDPVVQWLEEVPCQPEREDGKEVSPNEKAAL